MCQHVDPGSLLSSAPTLYPRCPATATRAGSRESDPGRNKIQGAMPVLHATRLNTEALRTRRQQATAFPDPFATVSYQPFPVFTARGFQRSQWGIAQDVPFPGKLGLKGDIADHAADEAGYEADAFAQDLVFEVNGTMAASVTHDGGESKRVLASTTVRWSFF